MKNRIAPPRVSPNADTRLLSVKQRARLLANGWVNALLRLDDKREIDFAPVVKFFAPDSLSLWLLAEIDPGDLSSAFGLCDTGDGSPQLGMIDLEEMAMQRGPRGLLIRRDPAFVARATLHEYALYARAIGTIPA